MIILRLQGGLGNQLFQYALGRALGQRPEATVKFDATSYTGDEQRSLELTDYAVDLPLASRFEISRVRYGLAGHFLGKLLGRSPRPKPGYRRERSQRHDASIGAIGGDAYLDGYWQSEKYFLEAEPLLRGELVLREERIPAEVREAREAIEGCEAVSVHVRRGDYVSTPANQRIYHACGPEYYAECARRISSAQPEARFFVFSDDPEWARLNILPLLGPRASISGGFPKPSQDLLLMSRCRHHVIANSSFSWWGAWLNPAPGKLVLAPAKWFNDPAIDDSDMIPAAWTRV